MKKLELKKEVIATLDKEAQKEVQGGQDRYTQRATCGGAITCLWYPTCI